MVYGIFPAIMEKLIGCGGSYDESGDEVKIGLSCQMASLINHKQPMMVNIKMVKKFADGIYILINMEIIKLCINQVANKLSGGGSYEEEGCGTKIGQWIELSDGFYEYSQIVYIGQYKKGKKVDRWNIYHTEQGNQKTIGGGLYDEKCNGIKIGKWIELSDGFYDYQQVTYIGEYQNGIKVGTWDIIGKGSKIGGGSYAKEGEKIGIWIEQSEGFKYDSQITYYGEYKHGYKVGRWDIFKENILIGGGSYDEELNGNKIGNWIDLDEQFQDVKQITYNGEYKNGIKDGKWEIYDIQNNYKRGEINYDL